MTDSELDNLSIIEDEPEEKVIDPSTIDVSPENVVKIVQQQKMATLLSNKPVDRDEVALCDSLTTVAQKQQRLDVDSKAANSQGELAQAIASLLTTGTGEVAVKPTEKDITPVLPTIEHETIDNFVVPDAMKTTEQEEINLSDIMKADDLK